jgi:hypothetical protein
MVNTCANPLSTLEMLEALDIDHRNEAHNRTSRLVLTPGEKRGRGQIDRHAHPLGFLTRNASYRAFDAEGATGQLLRFHPSKTAAMNGERSERRACAGLPDGARRETSGAG